MLSNQTAEAFTLSGNMILWPLSKLIFSYHCYAAADLMQVLQWNDLLILNASWLTVYTTQGKPIDYK